MPHEPVYVLEMLADPMLSFGDEIRQDCADAAYSKRFRNEWGAQIDAGAPLLDWSYRKYLPNQVQFCILNDEFCIKSDELCVKDDEFCIQNDEFLALNA